MNFGQAILLLFALAKCVDAGEDETPQLRGLKTSISKNRYYINSYNENLGVCTGAMCGKYIFSLLSAQTTLKHNRSHITS